MLKKPISKRAFIMRFTKFCALFGITLNLPNTATAHSKKQANIKGWVLKKTDREWLQ